MISGEICANFFQFAAPSSPKIGEPGPLTKAEEPGAKLRTGGGEGGLKSF